jgi:tetratricopeptide (TPR) repeat protein
LSKPDAAIDRLEQYYQKMPSNRIRDQLIDCYYKTQQYQSALSLYNRWRRDCPTCQRPWLGSVELFDRLNQPDSSLAVCTRALQTWPSDPDLLQWAVIQCRTLKRQLEAENYARRWTRVDSSNGDAWVALAELLHQNDPLTACACYQKVPNHPVAAYRLTLSDCRPPDRSLSDIQRHAFQNLIDAVASEEKTIYQNPSHPPPRALYQRDSLETMIRRVGGSAGIIDSGNQCRVATIPTIAFTDVSAGQDL